MQAVKSVLMSVKSVLMCPHTSTICVTRLARSFRKALCRHRTRALIERRKYLNRALIVFLTEHLHSLTSHIDSAGSIKALLRYILSSSKALVRCRHDASFFFFGFFFIFQERARRS